MFCRSCLSQEVQPRCSCACYICSSLITIWNYNEPEKRLNSIWSRLGKQMTTLWWIVLNCFQAGTILVEIYLCCWMFTADIWDDVSKSRVSKLIICPAAQQEKVNSLKGTVPSWKRCRSKMCVILFIWTIPVILSWLFQAMGILGVLLRSCVIWTGHQVHWGKNIKEYDLIHVKTWVYPNKYLGIHLQRWDILSIWEVSVCYLNFRVDTSNAELSVNWLLRKQPNILLDMWRVCFRQSCFKWDVWQCHCHRCSYIGTKIPLQVHPINALYTDWTGPCQLVKWFK